VCTAIQLPRISFPRRTCTSFFFGGATAFFTIPLQASRSHDQSLSLSLRSFPSFSRPCTRHPAISFLVLLWCLAFYIIYTYIYVIYYIFILYPPNLSILGQSLSLSLSLFVYSPLSHVRGHVIQPSHFWSYLSSCCGVLHLILYISMLCYIYIFILYTISTQHTLT